MNKKSALRTFIAGGLLPVLAFALVEGIYGAKAGLIAGIAFGIGEVIYERWQLGRVQWITIVSNALVIVLGSLSLLQDNPALFKLQPAILILAFAAFIIASSMFKKPLLVELMKKQNPDATESMQQQVAGLNLRMGLCLIAIGLVGVHAAFYWSTPAWATFKAVGAPVLMLVYVALDVLALRWWRRR